MVKTLCFHCKQQGFISGQGTKIPQAAWCGQKQITTDLYQVQVQTRSVCQGFSDSTTCPPLPSVLPTTLLPRCALVTYNHMDPPSRPPRPKFFLWHPQTSVHTVSSNVHPSGSLSQMSLFTHSQIFAVGPWAQVSMIQKSIVRATQRHWEVIWKSENVTSPVGQKSPTQLPACGRRSSALVERREAPGTDEQFTWDTGKLGGPPAGS